MFPLALRLYSVVIVGREVYEWQRGGEAAPRASAPPAARAEGERPPLRASGAALHEEGGVDSAFKRTCHSLAL